MQNCGEEMAALDRGDVEGLNGGQFEGGELVQDSIQEGKEGILPGNRFCPTRVPSLSRIAYLAISFHFIWKHSTETNGSPVMGPASP